jgi:DNA-directed RNA polymerase sigma subunit (sigma70/sigma32)
MTNERTIRRGPEGIALELDSDAAEFLTVASLRGVLHDILNALDERATRIIRRRYGLDTGSPMTLHAIGMEEGVTRERIRQIEQAALKAFRREQEHQEQAVRARDALYGVLRMLGGSVCLIM